MFSFRTRRAVLAGCLLLGVFWNNFCMMGLLPFEKWVGSVGLMVVGSLFALLPVVFPGLKAQTSENWTDLKRPVRVLSGVTLGFGAAWLITVVACVVYPL